MQHGWTPEGPAEWLAPGGDRWSLPEVQGPVVQADWSPILQAVEASVLASQWHGAAKGHLGAGLEKGGHAEQAKRL
eukprot:9518875-Lingulodinium_polyedra.AAC.1